MIVSIEDPDTLSEDFSVHAAMMEHSSGYFNGLLQNATATNGIFHFKPGFRNGVNQFSFRLVLDFIYTGRPCISAPDMAHVAKWSADDGTLNELEVSVLIAADFFGVEDMVLAYTQLFQQRLTCDCVVYKLACICRVPGLLDARAAAVEHIVDNLQHVQVRVLMVRCLCAELTCGVQGWICGDSRLSKETLRDIVLALAAKSGVARDRP
jgi:hypothetical protein